MNRLLAPTALTAGAFVCLLFPSLAAADPVPIIHYQKINLAGNQAKRLVHSYLQRIVDAIIEAPLLGLEI